MRSEQEINEQANVAIDHEYAGSNPYPGKTYVEGVADALRWVLDAQETAPLEPLAEKG